MVIPLSWLTSRQTRLYRYLWRSVLQFDSVQAFADRLYAAGFVDVEVRTVPGWQRGILHTFRARKPAAAPAHEPILAPRPGRPRRAPPGRPGPTALGPAAEPTGPVLVAGGGIAGIAAAVGLAERGVRVMLVEPQQQLGGRVRAWPVEPRRRPGDDEPRLPRLLPAVLQPARAAAPGRPGPGAPGAARGLPAGAGRRARRLVRPDPAYAAAEPRRLRGPEPLASPCATWPRSTSARPWSCWTSTSRARFAAYDGESAAAFLDRLRFPDRARHLALEVFARSFFAHPSEFSAGELVAMFHTYFLGSSEGLLFDVPRDDYDTALWAPLGRYLDGLGVEVRTRRAGERRHRRATSCGVDARRRGTQRGGRAVVLATDPATTRTLLLDSGGRRTRLARAGGRPRDRAAVRGLAAVAGPAGRRRTGRRSWAPAGSGRWTTSRCWSGSRTARAGGRRDTAARWSSCTRTRWSASRTRAGSEAQLRAELDRIYPELAGAGVVAEEWLVRDDCPLVGTGPWADRLTVDTPDPRVGAGRRRHPLRLPGGPDGAGRDHRLPGRQRAAGRPWPAGHDLWTVPMRSRHRVSRRCTACSRSPLHEMGQ